MKSDRERSRSRKRDDGRRGSIGKGKGKEGVVDDDVVDDDDNDEKVERTDGRGEGEDEVLMVDVGEEIIDRAAAIIASLSPAAAILCSELNTRDNEADNGASS